jgi:hypothetical protein
MKILRQFWQTWHGGQSDHCKESRLVEDPAMLGRAWLTPVLQREWRKAQGKGHRVKDICFSLCTMLYAPCLRPCALHLVPHVGKDLVSRIVIE